MAIIPDEVERWVRSGEVTVYDDDVTMVEFETQVLRDFIVFLNANDIRDPRHPRYRLTFTLVWVGPKKATIEMTTERVEGPRQGTAIGG